MKIVLTLLNFLTRFLRNGQAERKGLYRHWCLIRLFAGKIRQGCETRPLGIAEEGENARRQICEFCPPINVFLSLLRPRYKSDVTPRRRRRKMRATCGPRQQGRWPRRRRRRFLARSSSTPARWACTCAGWSRTFARSCLRTQQRTFRQVSVRNLTMGLGAEAQQLQGFPNQRRAAQSLTPGGAHTQ